MPSSGPGHKGIPRPPWGISTGITAVGVAPGTGTLIGAADAGRERNVLAW